MTDLPRRAILGGAALSAVAAGAVMGRASAGEQSGEGGDVLLAAVAASVPDRAALAALAHPIAGQIAYLREAGRGGFFRCVAGSAPDRDPEQGLFVRSGSGGFHYARIWDEVHGRPEWFGALVNDGRADCADAIEACYALCPFTQLSQADYFIRRTLVFNRSWRTVRGVGNFATDEGRGTRIILQGSAPGIHSADIMVVGSVEKPAGSSERYPYENHFSNFTLIRDGAATPHGSGEVGAYPTGLRAAYLVRCTFREITSLESSVGFYVGGVVYTKVEDCLAQRNRAGTSSAGDIWIGYYLDGHISFGFAGGNASLYMTRCLTVGQNRSHVSPTGLVARGAFVDTFLDQFESAQIDTGISFGVDGATGVGQSVDLHIRNPVLDGCARFGLQIDLHETSSASVEIVDPYIYAAGGGGDRGILIHDGAGLVTITGGQVHGDFAGGSLWFSRTRGIRVQGTKIHQSSRPVVVTEASGLVLEPQISNVGKTSVSFAITCGLLSRSIVRPVIIAAGAPAFRGGVSLGGGSNFSQIDGSAVDPGAFTTADAGYKLWFNGGDARGGPNRAAFVAAGNVLAGVTG